MFWNEQDSRGRKKMEKATGIEGEQDSRHLRQPALNIRVGSSRVINHTPKYNACQKKKKLFFIQPHFFSVIFQL